MSSMRDQFTLICLNQCDMCDLANMWAALRLWGSDYTLLCLTERECNGEVSSLGTRVSRVQSGPEMALTHWIIRWVILTDTSCGLLLSSSFLLYLYKNNPKVCWWQSMVTNDWKGNKWTNDICVWRTEKKTWIVWWRNCADNLPPGTVGTWSDTWPECGGNTKCRYLWPIATDMAESVWYGGHV